MLVAALFGIILSTILRILDEYPILDLLVCSAGTILLCAYLNSGTPSAMDVYQGRTTLKVTYKDGVPVDSVVVFK